MLITDISTFSGLLKVLMGIQIEILTQAIIIVCLLVIGKYKKYMKSNKMDPIIRCVFKLTYSFEWWNVNKDVNLCY